MPENICFGCGKEHPEGLRIKSFWKEDETWCHWQADAKYQGWRGILNGGIIATLMDCHCMCSAMAAAYKEEGRSLGQAPVYRYATGTMSIRYMRPVRYAHPILLRARVQEIKGKKVTLACALWSEEVCAAKAEVIALRVYHSGETDVDSPFYAG